jgi:membrane protein implicated in regulation of membrane protease activity
VDWVTVAFLIAGVLLIASELVQLSLIPVFLGVAALFVAGLRGVGLLESVPMSLLVWSMTSVGLALPLRPLARRYLKTGERKVDHSHEDRDAMGAIVEVIEPVDDQSDSGRVRFQGTTWSARATDGTIPAGGQARLVYKDKLVWIVEPLSVLDESNRVPVLEEQASESRKRG